MRLPKNSSLFLLLYQSFPSVDPSRPRISNSFAPYTSQFAAPPTPPSSLLATATPPSPASSSTWCRRQRFIRNVLKGDFILRLRVRSVIKLNNKGTL